jgi:hypothetical protein
MSEFSDDARTTLAQSQCSNMFCLDYDDQIITDCVEFLQWLECLKFGFRKGLIFRGGAELTFGSASTSPLLGDELDVQS